MTSPTVSMRPKPFPTLDVTPRQELALLARVLHTEGYDDHLAGHITSRQPDGTFLVNPMGLAWDELLSRRRGQDGHRGQPDRGGLDHLAGGPPARRPPSASGQRRGRHSQPSAAGPRSGPTATAYPPSMTRRVPCTGARSPSTPRSTAPSTRRANALEVVEALGGADVALMVNHGVLVIGKDIREAYLRAAVLEWRSRQAWHVEALGSGVPMRDDVAGAFGALIATSSAKGNFDNWFAAGARRALRYDPTVLD